MTYFVTPASGGRGILVEKDDTVTIPEGWLTVSLDPSKSRGTFTRTGVNWFVEHLVSSRLPTEPAQVNSFLKGLDKEADEAIINSSQMPGVNPESEADMGRLFEVFKDEHDTIECTYSEVL